MLLWIAFAVLTAAVLAAVLAPLGRRGGHGAAAGGGSLEVYRHQLGELEAERARGLLEDSEAAAAKIEISRRLLASAAEIEQAVPGAASSESSRRPPAVAGRAPVPPPP